MCPLLFTILIVAQNQHEVEDASYPPLSDLQWMPSEVTINAAIADSIAYQARIESSILLWTYQEQTWRQPLLDDCTNRRRPWTYLKYARQGWTADRERRYYLYLLQEDIGQQAYNSGTLPQPSRQWVGDK